MTSPLAAAARYAVGNRVYNGGTNNPTSGTVDPSGYIQREVNKSSSRSGLAAAALERLRGSSGLSSDSGALSAAPASVQPLGEVSEFNISPTGQLVPVSAPPPSPMPGMGMQPPPPPLAPPPISGVPNVNNPLVSAALQRLGGGMGA